MNLLNESLFISSNTCTKTKSMKKPLHHIGTAYRVYKDRKLILPMLTDALRGRFRLSLFTLFVLVITLLYLIFPFDLLPDFIPFIGWIDDGVLLYFLLQQLKKETKRYAQYKASFPIPVK